MAKDAEFCPPLPAGSVDFNKLHEAAKKGEDLDEAVHKVTTTVKPPRDEAKSQTRRAASKTKRKTASTAKLATPPTPPLPPPGDSDKPA